MRHQQPPGTSLLNRVKPVAGGGLRSEVKKGGKVSQHDDADSSTLLKGGPAFGHFHLQRATRNLDDNLLGRCVTAEQSGHSDHTLVPDHPDFNLRAARHVGQDGGDSLLEEVNIFERSAGLVNYLAQG